MRRPIVKYSMVVSLRKTLSNSAFLLTFTSLLVMHPSNMFLKPLRRRIPFSRSEDERLRTLVEMYGVEGHWDQVAKYMPGRNSRQCRERYTKYLAPGIAFDQWTPAEDHLLDQMYAQFGPRWMFLTNFFPHRTDVALKNRWSTHKRLAERRSELAVSLVNPPDENDSLFDLAPDVLDDPFDWQLFEDIAI